MSQETKEIIAIILAAGIFGGVVAFLFGVGIGSGIGLVAKLLSMLLGL